MRIYLAGPMRGYPGNNFEAFDKVEKMWREAGHDPVSPAQLSRASGGPKDAPEYIREVMVVDTAVICRCDALAVLPRWENSRGSLMEVALANSIEIPIYDAMHVPELVRLKISLLTMVRI